MPQPSPESDDAIRTALFRGHKIEAIKLDRTATGRGLAESKAFVEALEAELRRTSPEKFTGPVGGGCGGTVLVALMMTAGLLLAALLAT